MPRFGTITLTEYNCPTYSICPNCHKKGLHPINKPTGHRVPRTKLIRSGYECRYCRYITDILWQQAKCPVCGSTYEYPENGYKPPTCKNFDCLHKYLHPELEGLRQ